MSFEILHGDCREAMAAMDADSVDSIVCDPPYGMSFMGKGWDHGVPGVEFWQAAMRVAKPGAYLLAFGGTRTFHRLMVAIEDAGWELRDTIGWIYGSGFPKSLDVSKAIDKAAGAERERVQGPRTGGMASLNKGNASQGYRDSAYYADGNMVPSSVPVTDVAKQWEGWGTALKPAWEPIVVARKPLVGTVAENVLRHGTGGMNIDGCRVETGDNLNGGTYSNAEGRSRKSLPPGDNRSVVAAGAYATKAEGVFIQPEGRWPANIIADGSEEVTALFPNTKGVEHTPRKRGKGGVSTAGHKGQDDVDERHHDTGSAARFFYQAKASKTDRNEGLTEGTVNNHPTVKPTALMRYLCRLVTPPGGLVLDPFCGSGSTGKAAVLEGFRFVGVEQDPAYVEIARARIAAALHAVPPAPGSHQRPRGADACRLPPGLTAEDACPDTRGLDSPTRPPDVANRPMGRRPAAQSRIQYLPGLHDRGPTADETP